MKKVVIIGAGPAGLTLAYELLKQKKYNVIIIEKEKQVGGISKTVKLDDNYLVDTGIHRFFSKSEKVNNIWQEILQVQSKPAYDDIKLNRNKELPLKGSDPEKEDKSMLIKDRYTRIYYRNNFFDYPVNLKFENLRQLGFFTILKIGFSYIKVKIKKRPEKSLEDFYINRFGKTLYNIFFENYTQKVWGIHPSNISADWGEQRVKGISIVEVIKDYIKRVLKIKQNNKGEVSLIDTFLYPKFGAGQMWEEMLQKIKQMGGKIITEAEVVGIEVEDDNIKQIKYKIEDEVKEENVDILASSMPIKELVSAINSDEIPQKVYEIATKLPYREFMSVCMVVRKLNLKNKTKIKTMGNIVPDDWIYIQEPDVKMGRIQIFNNWSPYLFKDKTNMDKEVLIGLEYFCSEDDEDWNMKDEDFIDFATKEAIKIGLFDKDDVIVGKRIKIPKAYPAYFGTYKNIDEVIKYLDGFSNLYCIGRNGQHRYNNMDHSMLTAIETANNITNGINSKENIWNVNTEKEYHEIKNKGQ